MNKKTIKVLSAALLCGGILLSGTIVTHASNIPVTEIDNREANYMGITPSIYGEIRDLSYVLSGNLWGRGEITMEERLVGGNDLLPSIYETHTPKVNNDMIIKDGELIAAHTATLKNSTDQTQNLSTTSFEYTSEAKVTTTNTHATGISETSQVEMKFPIASGSQSVTASYNYSHTKSVESTETQKWNMPSQTITVPAHKTYKVEWILIKGKAEGTTNLDATITGVIPYKRIKNSMRRDFMPIGEAVNLQNTFERDHSQGVLSWSPIHSWSDYNTDLTTASKTVGRAKYKAEYGVELVMEVYDVTNNSNPIKVTSETLNVAPTISEN